MGTNPNDFLSEHSLCLSQLRLVSSFFGSLNYSEKLPIFFGCRTAYDLCIHIHSAFLFLLPLLFLSQHAHAYHRFGCSEKDKSMDSFPHFIQYKPQPFVFKSAMKEFMSQRDKLLRQWNRVMSELQCKKNRIWRCMTNRGRLGGKVHRSRTSGEWSVILTKWNFCNILSEFLWYVEINLCIAWRLSYACLINSSMTVFFKF